MKTLGAIPRTGAAAAGACGQLRQPQARVTGVRTGGMRDCRDHVLCAFWAMRTTPGP